MSDNSMMLDSSSSNEHIENATTSTTVATTTQDFNPFIPAIETPADQVEVSAVRTVQTVDEHGQTITLKAQQMKFPEIYKLHVQQYGRQIEDDEEADLRIFTAISIYKSTGNNADITNQLQKIKTKAEYDAFFQKRNVEVEGIHHLLDMQEKKALQDGTPLQNPLENEKFKEHVRLMVEQMEKVGMLEDAPNYKLEENTVEARVKKIRELQAQGYDIDVSNMSDELRKQLEMPNSASEYKNLVDQSKKIEEALKEGFQTSNTVNPADPQQAEALAQQIEGAALIKKRVLDNQNPILRCQRTADGKTSELAYYLAAKDFSDLVHKLNIHSNRLDLVAPVEPVVADKAMSDVLRNCFVTDLMSNRLDALVHPSKLYLYLTGVSHPKMVLFSDVRIFYAGMKKFYSETNMRPAEKTLSSKLKTDREEMKKKMESLGLSAVISQKPVPDAHLETHSKERITVVLNVGRERAELEYNSTVQRIIEQTAPNDEEATKKCLKEIYDAQRIHCIQLLNSFELALLLYLEDYIPFQMRADLMTDASEGCACCVPKDAVENINNRRAWLNKFRKSTFLVKEAEVGRRINIDHLCMPSHQTDRIDMQREWTPTWQEMFDYVRYFVMKPSKVLPGMVDEESEKAHRWVTRYVNDMQPAV